MPLLEDRTREKDRRDSNSVNGDWVINQIADGIKEKTGVYESYPVDAEEFYLGKDFMNLERWEKDKQYTGGGYVFNKLIDELIEIDQEEIWQVMLLWGKGSGKGFGASCINVREKYKDLSKRDPQRFYGLPPNEKIFYINLSTAGRQAQDVVFSAIINRLRNSNWFTEMEQNIVGKDLGEFVPLGSEIRFNKSIYDLCGNSRAFSWLGYPVRVGVCDEIAWFTDQQDKSNAEACWDVLEDSCETRFPGAYKLVGITSPRSVDGFEMRKFEELRDWKHGHASQKATWEINEKLPRSHFNKKFKTNPVKAKRDFGARPPHVQSSFWGDDSEVEKLKDYLKRDLPCNFDFDTCRLDPDFVPEAGAEYYVHVDLGAKKDACAMGMSCVDSWKDDPDTGDSKIVVRTVLIARWKPEPNRQVKVKWPRLLIYELTQRGFQFGLITFDQWGSIESRQELEDRGYDVELLSLDRTTEVCERVQEVILDHRALIPFYDVLLSEMKGLEDIKGKKIDHRKGGCFTGDTKVQLLDGRWLSFFELCSEFKDKSFWVYSIDKNKNIVPGLAKNPRCTKENSEIMEVELDNHEIVKCTLDHKFMMRDGTYKEAQNLKPEDCLMPIYKRYDNASGMNGYETIWNPGGGGFDLTHRMVDKSINGKKRKGICVHHKDNNKRNNSPENLERLTPINHAKTKVEFNRVQMLKFRSDPEFEKKRFENFLKYCKSEKGRNKLKENIKCAINAIKRNDITFEKIIKESKQEKRLEYLCKKLKCGKNKIRGLVKENGFKDWPDFLANYKNHIVTKISFNGEIQNVYDISVFPHSNFALASGVFVHNSKDVWDGVCGSIYNTIIEAGDDVGFA